MAYIPDFPDHTSSVGRPRFSEQTAIDVDRFARELRLAIRKRKTQRQTINIAGCDGRADGITINDYQARAILRAIAPLALVTGRSRLRVGKLSQEIADFLAALTQCGPAFGDRGHSLGQAIAAGNVLHATLGATIDALRWKQATSAAGMPWQAPETAAPKAITAVLRQSMRRKTERSQNTQASLLLPIPGGASAAQQGRADRQTGAAAAPPPLIMESKAG